jgi:hypothetical protein
MDMLVLYSNSEAVLWKDVHIGTTSRWSIRVPIAIMGVWQGVAMDSLKYH